MIDKPPFTYCSRKQLKSGPREYWRFRHPKVGHSKLPGRPGDEEFNRKYTMLMKKAGNPAAIIASAPEGTYSDLQIDTHWVYFIGIHPRGPVKIGYSTNPQKRLAALQTGSSQSLRLLATLRGGPRVEKILHEALDAERISGEWFRRSARLSGFITQIRAGRFSI